MSLPVNLNLPEGDLLRLCNRILLSLAESKFQSFQLFLCRYANTQLYPWQIASGDSKLTTWADTQAVTWGVSGCNQNTTCALANLTSTTTELKSSFKTRLQDTNNTKIYAHNIGTTGSSTYLCFKPKSQTFAKVASARCIAGLPSDAPSSSTQACPTGCSVAGTDSCFYCIP